jgi:hypothetical protein
MAARTVKIRHDEETRAKIQTSQLINRLHAHVFEDVEVSQTQMKAIELLLRKTLPDLSAISIGGDEGAPPVSMIITGVPRAGD